MYSRLWTLLLIGCVLSEKVECETAMRVGMLGLKMAFGSKM
jgi:hypothetical protein